MHTTVKHHVFTKSEALCGNIHGRPVRLNRFEDFTLGVLVCAYEAGRNDAARVEAWFCIFSDARAWVEATYPTNGTTAKTAFLIDLSA